MDFGYLRYFNFFVQYFSKLRETMVSAQSPDKQTAMALCFDSLMEGVDRTLLTKNRDKWVEAA